MMLSFLQSIALTNVVQLFQLVHSNFTLSTWLLLGACLQTVAFLTIKNEYYATLPAAFLLIIRTVNATLIHFGIKPNPFLEEAFLKKRITAAIPNGEGNLIAPGTERVAIILLGAKSNHPFGVLSPEFLKTFKWLAEMNASFDQVDGPGGCKSFFKNSTPEKRVPLEDRR